MYCVMFKVGVPTEAALKVLVEKLGMPHQTAQMHGESDNNASTVQPASLPANQFWVRLWCLTLDNGTSETQVLPFHN